jgi:hypothetical protein
VAIFPEEGLDQGRFSGSVRSQDHQSFAFIYLQRDIPEYLRVALAYRYLVELDYRTRRHGPFNPEWIFQYVDLPRRDHSKIFRSVTRSLISSLLGSCSYFAEKMMMFEREQLSMLAQEAVQVEPFVSWMTCLGLPLTHPMIRPLEPKRISLGKGAIGITHFHPLWKRHSSHSIVLSMQLRRTRLLIPLSAILGRYTFPGIGVNIAVFGRSGRKEIGTEWIRDRYHWNFISPLADPTG